MALIGLPERRPTGRPVFESVAHDLRYVDNASALMQNVRSSMSTNSVSAPAWLMASTVAMNVCETVTTASPLPTPEAINANRTASVPLATPTQYVVPQ